MSIDEPRGATVGRIWATAGAVAANLTVFFFAVVQIAANVADLDGVVTQEIWWPVMVLGWVQVGLNGVLLLLVEKTRPFGVGVLVGTLGTFVVYLLFLRFVFSPSFY